jgi:hypothetical protein
MSNLDLWYKKIHIGLRNISLPQIYANEFSWAQTPTGQTVLYQNRCHRVGKLHATGFSMNPRSCPWPAANESSIHWFESVIGPYWSHSTKGIWKDQDVDQRGVNSRTWKITTFSQLLNQVWGFRIFFRILREIRRIQENVRIFRPIRGGTNSTEIKLAQMWICENWLCTGMRQVYLSTPNLQKPQYKVDRHQTLDMCSREEHACNKMNKRKRHKDLLLEFNLTPWGLRLRWGTHKGWMLTDKRRIHLRSARTYTFFTTGFPRFLSIRGARGLQVFDLPLLTNYSNPNND